MKKVNALGSTNGPKLMLILGVFVVILLLVATLAALMFSQANKNLNTLGGNSETADCTDRRNQGKVTITYTADETFEPACVKVLPSTKITYKNVSKAMLEVGVDPHPSHTGNREVSNGEFDLPVAPGKSASTTMKKIGEFGIHNHVHASVRGKIIVSQDPQN